MHRFVRGWQAMILLVGFGTGCLVNTCLLVYYWLLLFRRWAGLVVYRVVYWTDPYQATKQEADRAIQAVRARPV